MKAIVLAQSTMFPILDAGQNLGSVFQDKLVKDKYGKEIGHSISFRKRSEIAELLDLKGKDNREELTKAMLKQSDEGLKSARAFLAKLSDDNTLLRFRIVKKKNGRTAWSIAGEEVKRWQGPSIDDICKVTGLTKEQVLEMVAKQEASNAKSLDVEEVKPTEGLTPEEIAQIEADEAELKAMEEAEAKAAEANAQP